MSDNLIPMYCPISEVFEGTREFEACHKAEDWCRVRGISVGRMDRYDSRGLLVGDFDIAKWHNLSKRDIAQLHGTMRGDMRHGPITVSLRLTHPQFQAVQESLASNGVSA